MTDQEINQAIAEACGWKRCKYCADYGHKSWRYPSDDGCQPELPNYCDDLNAMFEAEEWLLQQPIARGKARTMLELLAGMATHHWHANARQRAEAFLRTVGKWKDKRTEL